MSTRARLIFLAICALVGGYIGWSNANRALDILFQGATGILRPSEKVLTGQTEGHEIKPTKGLPRISPDGSVPAPEKTFDSSRTPGSIFAFLVLGGMLGLFLGFQLLGIYDRASTKWDTKDPTERFVIIGGTIIGIVVSFPFILFLQALSISQSLLPWCYLTIMVASIVACEYLVSQIAEFLPANRGRGPVKRTGIKVLDTSVIIDGRIYEVAQKGFLEGQLYIPRFILEEVQLVADHHDPLKRQRGKRGLEVLRKMQGEFQIDTGSKDHFAADVREPVDSRLVRLARALGADLVTNDHNLNQVASLQDIRVLNVNDLALSLRPAVLPQEHLMITIIREGNQLGQGVGYLDDGTMVVVENGRDYIGSTTEIMVTQVIQTERGKMIFGEVEEDEAEAIQQRKIRGTRSQGGR